MVIFFVILTSALFLASMCKIAGDCSREEEKECLK